MTSFINPLIDGKLISHLRQLLEHSQRIVITCHISPDGDAIGSSLGLAAVLSRLGKSVSVITPDMAPRNLMFMPGAKDIVVYSRYADFARELIAKADLIFALDYNDLKRIDQLGDPVAAARAPKVMIDHHLHPADFALVTISHPEVSSTSMLIFRTLCQLSLYADIDKDAATCIYTGMMTDTGNFSYNSNDPDLYVAISELLRKGIDKDAIYRRVYYSATPSRLRLNGYALDQKMVIYPDHRAALITLTRDELNHYDYQRGDTEGLVNQPLTIPEVIYSFYLREEDGYIKVSARSKGDFPVNLMCQEHFGGGGHLNAAGGEVPGATIDQAVERLVDVMPLYDKYLPK